jgi:hypothetical protein
MMQEKEEKYRFLFVAENDWNYGIEVFSSEKYPEVLFLQKELEKQGCKCYPIRKELIK